MLSAATVSGSPPVTVSSGCSTPNTRTFEHRSDPFALTRRPEMDFPAIEVLVSPPAMIRFLMANQSSVGFAASRRAAMPVTCGDAMDVPLRYVYVLGSQVLNTSWPGAPTATVRAP